MNGQQFFKQLMSKAKSGVVEVEESAEVRKGLEALPDLLFASGVEMDLDTVNDRMVFEYLFSKVAVYARQVSTTKVEMTYKVLRDFDAEFEAKKSRVDRAHAERKAAFAACLVEVPEENVWDKLERRLAAG